VQINTQFLRHMNVGSHLRGKSCSHLQQMAALRPCWPLFQCTPSRNVSMYSVTVSLVFRLWADRGLDDLLHTQTASIMAVEEQFRRTLETAEHDRRITALEALK
jgi:hypothetical protein